MAPPLENTTTIANTSTTNSGPTTVMSTNVVIGLDSLPTYDGTTGIEEFLSVVEETGVLARWTDQQLVSIARLKLRNRAKQFIDSEPALRTTNDWNHLKTHLKKQFTRQYVKGAAMKNFIECRQRSGESCRQYLTRLKLLGNRTITITGNSANDDPIRSKLEQDITTQFTLGLLMPIKQRVLSGNPQTLDEALKIAEREESIENLIHPTSTKECRLVKNDNYPGKNIQNTYVSKPPNLATGKNIIKCFKCNKTGHTANFCRMAKPFTCFKCNKAGHFIKDCPENRTGHIPREKLCYSCNRPGHLARNCTTKNRQEPRQEQPNLNANAVTYQPRSLAANETDWE